LAISLLGFVLLLVNSVGLVMKWGPANIVFSLVAAVLIGISIALFIGARTEENPG
jgi:hypothetical protein